MAEMIGEVIGVFIVSVVIFAIMGACGAPDWVSGGLPWLATIGWWFYRKHERKEETKQNQILQQAKQEQERQKQLDELLNSKQETWDELEGKYRD